MNNKSLALLMLLSAVMMSLPWLVPHLGVSALVGLVPLLWAERSATAAGKKHFFLWYYLCFVLWNAFTTFWVCNATVAGGIFAILANALQMAAVFALFRFSRRRFSGVLPYVFLVCAWLAWECFYFKSDISWPWLVLGGAFARSAGSVQWYSVTGILGGSLWVWLCNLLIFSLASSISDGRFGKWNAKARGSLVAASVLIIPGPLVLSAVMNATYEEKSEGKVDVLVCQPSFDPYQKFESMTQSEQTAVLLGQCKWEKAPDLVLAPETFTSDIWLNNVEASPTVSSLRGVLRDSPSTSILFGASTHRWSSARTSPLSFTYGDGWIDSYNSAVMLRDGEDAEVYHKSRLVIGTELTPYPSVFIPFEKLVCRITGQKPPLMGRCQGQKEVSLLHLKDGTPLGCAVCYESVYGDYCTGYVKKGAKALTVITNDAWWGNTPGYRQHLAFSCLRAIELRRDIARCGNTGISAFIDQRGRILSCGHWWTRQTLRSEVNLNSRESVFVRTGDVVGRAATFLFLLLLLALAVRFLPRTR